MCSFDTESNHCPKGRHWYVSFYMMASLERYCLLLAGIQRLSYEPINWQTSTHLTSTHLT